jgi:hypothetical protein
MSPGARRFTDRERARALGRATRRLLDGHYTESELELDPELGGLYNLAAAIEEVDGRPVQGYDRERHVDELVEVELEAHGELNG